MSQTDSDEVLRRSLDAVDVIHRRVMWAAYLTVAGTFGAFFWLSHIARTSDNVNNLLMAAVLALTCVIAWSTFALAIFIVRMTKRILRAIDLASTR
jgi:hypothetical protein